MRLYLIQHGEALPKDVDPDRPLSDRGRSDVERAAALLAGPVGVVPVVHSGKTRARETAELIAARLGPGCSVRRMPGLAPNDPVAPCVEWLAGLGGDTLVVGHLPFLAKLVSRLLTGVEEPEIVSFCPGSALCLESSEAARWRVLWMIRPELLGSY